MNYFAADRNLLVGILGLQTGLISESQLVSAMQTWIFQKSRTIESILAEQGVLNPERQEFLAGLAEKHIALHANNPARSIASLSSAGAAQKRLCDLEDEDLSQSIARIDQLRNLLPCQDSIYLADTVSMPVSNGSTGDRFRVLRPHAKGGLGQVSIAEDRELHREVALKEIQPEFAADPESRNRFLIEAEVTGRLEHPGIVPVYSLGSTDSGCPFYVMRFIKGDSLKDAIVQLHSGRKRLTPDAFRMSLRRLVRRLIDVCNAIEYAHSRGVLHRDLKPGNIMLGKYGETLVVDWGLAKTGAKPAAGKTSDEQTFVPLSSDASSETRMGSVVGTLAYMSPEQAEGRLDALGPASDVYGLGATLYCVLTGEPPIPKLPAQEMLLRVRSGQIQRPKDRNPDVPAALEAVCLKAMALRQSDRYQTTATLASELDLWLADEPVTAFREPFFDRATRFVRQHRPMVASGIAILTTALIALLIMNLLVQNQNASLKIARDEADDRREEADQERRKADDSRLQAVKENERAQENLASSRNLSLVLLTTAEEKLTKPVIDGVLIQSLRQTLTEEAFESFRKIYEQNPSDSDVAFEFAQVLKISGNLKRLERDLKTADERIKLSLQLQLQRPEVHRTLKQKDYLAETYREVGTLQKAEGKLSEADTALANALSIAVDLLAARPDNRLFRRTKATIELEQIGLFDEWSEYETALQKSLSSGSAFEELLKGDQATDNDGFLLLFSLARKIKLLYQLNRIDEAQIAATAAIATGRELHEKRPNDTNITLPFARMLYWSAAGIVDSQGPTPEAVSRMSESVMLLDGLAKATPRAGHIYGLGEALRIQAQILRLQMKFPEAEDAVSKSQQWLEKLVKASRKADNLDVLAKTLSESGQIKAAAGDKPAAVELARHAVEIQREACSLAPENVQMQKACESMVTELQRLESSK